MKKLLVIDGMNLLFRSYYATSTSGTLMKNQLGQTTNAVFGFVSAFQQILQMDFTDILVAFDSKGPTHRHLMFEEYKGTRKEPPVELIEQIPYIKDYLDAQGIPRYEQSGFEADDIVGYMIKHRIDEYDAIEVLSNDRDLFQLLNPKVKQIISKKGLKEVEEYTPESLYERLGIHPHQMTDFKGLVGDVSDNIPGVPGIGEKTAVKLLQEYGSLEKVLEHKESLAGKLKERLITYEEQAKFSKVLATIVVDFDNEIPKNLAKRDVIHEQLRNFYQTMELHTFLRKLEIAKPKVVANDSKAIFIHRTEDIVIPKKGPITVYLELFGENYHIAKPIGLGMQMDQKLYYIPFSIFEQSLTLQELLKNPKIEKYTYDYKAQKVALLWLGYDFEGVVFDLKLASYIVNPNSTKDDFRVVCSAFDYHDVAYDEEIFGKGAKKAIPDSIDILANHITSKVRAIHSLQPVLTQKHRENNQTQLYQEMELPLSRSLAFMEKEGISVDEAVLDELGTSLASRISEIEKQIYHHAEGPFNINSPKQLGIILFEKLNLPYYKKNKSGYSTDISVLNQLVGFHPIISPIIEYRSLTKLYSTYYEGLKNALRLKEDGKIHTIYQQMVAQTGRLSSIEPNLQNIPIRTEEGRELRKIFISKPGHQLYSVDYSQIELRVLAEMADCQGLKEAFVHNQDVHVHTAKKIFQEETITDAKRRQAKAINFGIIYGKTPWGLSEDLQIPLKQAEQFIQQYFQTFPEIKTFMDLQIKLAQEQGYVETLFHRRRYIPEVQDANYQVREFGKRMAMNAPIQGTAADLLKMAMVQIQKAIETTPFQSKLLLQIHDELVFDVLQEERDAFETMVMYHLSHVTPFSVPLVAQGGFGSNLYEVK